MLRFLCVTAYVLSPFAATYAGDVHVDLTKLDRVIVKEPAYEFQPRYALIVIGPRAEHRAWFVVDGEDVAYIDRNGDGDLTAPDERVALNRETTKGVRFAQPSAYLGMNDFTLGKVAGSHLLFRLWVPNTENDADQDESAQQHPEIRAFVQEMRKRQWLNGSLMRRAADNSAAQIPLALTTHPDDAQICHLLGPTTFQLKHDHRQRLEPWPKKSTFDVNMGSRNLPPRDLSHFGFDFSPLTTSEVPADVHPVAKFEYPATTPDGLPLRDELALDQRCCGDTVYAQYTVPKGVTSGIVKVTVAYPAWLDALAEPAQFNVPINQERSEFGEAGYVMFHDSAIGLKDAVNVLRKQRFDVTIRDDSLLIAGEHAPAISIRLNRGPEVVEIATGLAAGTEFADDLSRCDGRFEIGPYQDKHEQTMLQIENLLQDITDGFVYHTWDQRLTGPK